MVAHALTKSLSSPAHIKHREIMLGRVPFSFADPALYAVLPLPALYAVLPEGGDDPVKFPTLNPVVATVKRAIRSTRRPTYSKCTGALAR
jgi:hypothetical protein